MPHESTIIALKSKISFWAKHFQKKKEKNKGQIFHRTENVFRVVFVYGCVYDKDSLGEKKKPKDWNQEKKNTNNNMKYTEE